jgi:uncharacterized protein (TIGR00255 family)
MTGFAAAEIGAGPFKLVCEIRSVNHRYLDLGFRLPDELRALEPELRKRIGDRIKRGKVDCSLKLIAAAGAAAQPEIDAAALTRLRTLERQVIEACPDAGRLSVVDILRWPGMIKEDTGAREELLEPALACFSEAVAALRQTRASEGERLADVLREKLDAIGSLMTGIQAQLAAAAPRYRDRLLERLARLDVEVNPERLEQEVALIAQRVDVTEEADRLRGHLIEIRDVLDSAEPIGRRLDFLIQELNREANTLASKVQDDELARRAVDLKVLVEQMREQVQNIE